MKILINAVSAKSGGAATYIRNLACSIPTLDQHNQYVLYVPSQYQESLAHISARVKVVGTDIGSKPAWRRFLWDQIILRRIAWKEKADILLSSSDFGILFPSCHQIIMVRNPLFFSSLYLDTILPTKSYRYNLEFTFRRWLIARSVMASDLVMTASKSMLDDVRRFIPIPEGRAMINAFGVPLARFDCRWKMGERERPCQNGSCQLLYVTEYSDYKNLTTLLKAMLLLRERGEKEISLLCTADPSNFPHVEISSRELDHSLAMHPMIVSCVRFTGPLPYEDIPKLYGDSDVFVFPSLAESFGHPLVEAMASGLPVIASDIPVCREICGDAAVYFSPLDTKDLAEKVVLLCRDSSLRKRLGQIGRERAETLFNWDDHVRRLVEAVSRVASTT